jgi:ubiquitin
MGPKKKLGGKKKDSDGSDSEREDAGNKEDKAAAAKSPR